MERLAVFDIDGTLFRSSLVIELVEMMVERGLFPREAREFYAGHEQRWLDRRQSYEAYVNAVVDAFMTHLKGVHFADFDAVAREVATIYRKRVYRYTRDIIAELKHDGYFLLAISQSPKRVLDIFCDGYGFDKVYGRVYELGPSDRFTGAIIDEHLISNKANIVRRAVEREQLTLDGSVGVGDTDDDISFLELVETPVCFNPNSTLYRHAKINGWRVTVERKDVIYEIQ